MKLVKQGGMNTDFVDRLIIVDQEYLAGNPGLYITVTTPYELGIGQLDVYYNGQLLSEGGGYEEIDSTTIHLNLGVDADGNPYTLQENDEISIRNWVNRSKYHGSGNGSTTADLVTYYNMSYPQLTNVQKALDFSVTGGWKTVDTMADRDALPSPIREELMIVAVKENGKAYQLVGGVENTNWVVYDSGSNNIKVIVFVIPNYLKQGVQSVEIPFPFDGKITYVNASLITPGSSDTEIQIEKIGYQDYINGSQDWEPLLSTNLLIEAGKKSSLGSDNNIIFTDNTVHANDYFRINLPAVGEGAVGITSQILIELQ